MKELVFNRQFAPQEFVVFVAAVNAGSQLEMIWRSTTDTFFVNTTEVNG